MDIGCSFRIYDPTFSKNKSLVVLKGHHVYLNVHSIVSRIKLTGDFKASDSEKDLGLTISYFNILYKPTE